MLAALNRLPALGASLALLAASTSCCRPEAGAMEALGATSVEWGLKDGSLELVLALGWAMGAL